MFWKIHRENLAASTVSYKKEMKLEQFDTNDRRLWLHEVRILHIQKNELEELFLTDV